MNKVTPFLMYSDRLDDALEFYRSLFPDLEVRSAGRSGSDGPIQSAEFVMGGQPFKAFAGGPGFTFSEGVSLFVDCEDQGEVDAFWAKFVEAGGTAGQCGWIRDPFGLSWQVVPRRFTELMADPDPEKVKAVVDAMMTMRKLDVAALERAHAAAGGSA
jgi:predicted 3-demethylubiquinone-9 3-methyltransferase (glyoxalase superfamily)